MAASGGGGRSVGSSSRYLPESRFWNDYDSLLLVLEVARFVSVTVGIIALLSIAK